MFCIVEFVGGRKRTVVPDTWLSINNTLCLLPPKATDSDLEVLVRNLAEPGKGWQMLKVSSLETFESYSEAKKQLKKSKEKWQSETSSQRKRKKPSYLEDYTTHDSEDDRPYTVFGEDFDEEAISENEWIPPLEYSPRIKNVSTVKKTIRSDHRPWNHQFSQSQLSSQKENIDITCDCQSTCHSTFLQVLHSMQKQLNRTNQVVQQLQGGQKQTHSQLKRILKSQSVNQMNSQEEMDVFLQDDTSFVQCAAEEVVLPTLEKSREDGTPCLPTISPRTQPLTQEASTSNEPREMVENAGSSNTSSTLTPRQLKKYCVVAFPKENIVDVVPKNWLVQKTGQNYLCMWPPTDDRKELQRLSKAAMQPEDAWVMHECELIHSSKSYAGADAAMKHYQSGKDLDMFSTDTEWSQHSRLLSTSSIPDPTTAASNQVFDVNCSNCSDSENRIISLEQEVQSVKKILFEVKVNSQAMLVSVQTLIDQITPQRFEGFTRLTTVQELKAFNEQLIDNDVFSKMILFFSAFGGKDAHCATRKIMSVLMSNDLARQYNWIGTSSKNSFQEFKLIIQLVAASVRHIKSHAETPVTKIESWVARWLRYATDRVTAGRKKKQVSELLSKNY